MKAISDAIFMILAFHLGDHHCRGDVAVVREPPKASLYRLPIKRESRSAEKKAQANGRAKETREYRKKIRDKQRGEEEIRIIEEGWEKSRPRRRMDN